VKSLGRLPSTTESHIPARYNPAKMRILDDQWVYSVATKIQGQRVVLAISHDHDEFGDADDVWGVALYVGATRTQKKSLRTAADWSGGAHDSRGQGQSGLRPMAWAVREIQAFREAFPEATVVVAATDERRATAYRWLRRKGFQEGMYRDEPYLFAPPLKS
jgi:hypothetical protein